jgi:hypothetical protein
MTNSEIIAYNAGVDFARTHPGEPTIDGLAEMMSSHLVPDAVAEAAETLGTALFYAWAQQGAWDKYTGRAR